MLTTAMEYQSVPSYVQDIVTGTILILLILLDRLTANGHRADLSFDALIRRFRTRGRQTHQEEKERTIA